MWWMMASWRTFWSAHVRAPKTDSDTACMIKWWWQMMAMSASSQSIALHLNLYLESWQERDLRYINLLKDPTLWSKIKKIQAKFAVRNNYSLGHSILVLFNLRALFLSRARSRISSVIDRPGSFSCAASSWAVECNHLWYISQASPRYANGPNGFVGCMLMRFRVRLR